MKLSDIERFFVAMLVILAIVIAGGFCGSVLDSTREFWQPLKFNSETWKKADKKMIEEGIRQRMLNDLRDHRLIGKSRQEIVQELGPDEAGPGNTWDMRYHVNTYDELVLKFEGDKVKSYKIYGPGEW